MINPPSKAACFPAHLRLLIFPLYCSTVALEANYRVVKYEVTEPQRKQRLMQIIARTGMHFAETQKKKVTHVM